jgi:hypothetical protein
MNTPINKRSNTAPNTPLAKAFRLHGVKLTKNLTSSTSWAQKTMKGKIVLTLSLDYIDLKGKTLYYDSFSVKEKKWERLPANKQRTKYLSSLSESGKSHIRVIQVLTRKIKNSHNIRIISIYSDFQYWKLIKLDLETGRMILHRTNVDCDPCLLSYTEL